MSVSVSWVDGDQGKILKVVEKTDTIMREAYYNLYTSQFKHNNEPWWPMSLPHRGWVETWYLPLLEK